MTCWDRTILEHDDLGSGLTPRLDRLFAQQRDQWDRLREAVAALATMRTKTLTSEGARIVVQANPGRKRSIHARVDPRALADRCCFLCPENLPAEERGIGMGQLVILPNPYPVVHRHCTVPDRVHRPQQLTGRIAEMFELARAVGPEMLVFYNGPRCGASAPDHFHYQVCDARCIPLLSELPLAGRGSLQKAYTSFGRKVLLLADPNADQLRQRLEHALAVLHRLAPTADLPSHEEPMFNLIAQVREGRTLVILFPRAAHRPSCYDAPEDARFAISPATLEMAGLLVVAEPEQLGRVDVQTARAIYQEVSLGDGAFGKFVKEVGKF